MAGMPQTGKSTFLGALYHVLESGLGQAIELDALPSARRHLEGLRGRWLRVEREGRTSKADTILNELRLRFEDSGKVLALNWPDLSGEYFDDMVRKRTLNGEVADILGDATALIVFLHPDTVTQQPRIHAVNRVTGTLEAGTVNEAQADSRATRRGAQRAEWDPMMVPGQVLVVELIQLLLESQCAGAISGISLIVSAWDELASSFGSPEEYINEQLPLLDQFLAANAGGREIKLFGVSAHGGNPETDRARLLGEINPVDRIQVVRGDGTTTDDGILAPIRWLIE